MAGNTDAIRWPPLITKRTCEWCSSPCWMKDEFPRICHNPWTQWPTDLLLDLQYCEDCVIEYHRIRDDFVSNNPQKKKHLWQQDVQRLTLWTQKALQSSQESQTRSDALELLDNFENKQHNIDDVSQTLHVPLLEILQHPQLLFDKTLADLFVKAMSLLIDNGTPLILLEKYSGIYILLVHPSLKLRKWGNKTIQRLTRVSSDEYDVIKDAIQWMIGVVTLNMFDNDILLMEDLDVSSSSMCLPSHLFDLKCPLEYWKGLMRLLLNLEGEVLCYKVLGVSGHRDLPDTILNAIEDKGLKSLFWPAFTCLVIILERCGPRIWPMVTRQPLQVFHTITTHRVYCEELKRYRQCANDNNRPTDEHMEHGESQDNTSGDVQRGATNTAIGWFQPFVFSVLDYGEVTVDCVTEVIKFLDKLTGQTRKREIIVKLCTIVSRVVHSGRISSLLPTADMWVMHVVNLSSLDVKNQEVFRSIVQPSQEVITKLLTKMENRPGLPAFKNIDFTRLSTETERQNLAGKLLDHLKGEIKIPVKCKKEPTSHIRPKYWSCAKKSMRPSSPSAPQSTSEGTQTIGKSKIATLTHNKCPKKGFGLKSLEVKLVDFKNIKRELNSTPSSIAVTPNVVLKKDTTGASTSTETTTSEASSSRQFTSLSSLSRQKNPITSSSTSTTTSFNLLNTISNTVASSGASTMSLGAAITSSATPLPISRTVNTTSTKSRTAFGVMESYINKNSTSIEGRIPDNAVIAGSCLKDAGFDKSNPITLDSDDDSDQPETGKFDEQRKDFTSENKESRTINQGTQNLNISPSDAGGRSVSPEKQRFSVFKSRSIEKSKERLNRLKKLNKLGVSSSLNASVASSDTQINSSSTVIRTTAKTNSSTVETKSTNCAENSSVVLNISSSSSANDMSLLNESVDDVKFKDWKCGNWLFKKEKDSSDDTISLEDSDDDLIIGRKNNKRKIKKQAAGRKLKMIDLDSSDDTESLEDQGSLSKDLETESEVDSDEPLKDLCSPLRTRTASSTKTKVQGSKDQQNTAEDENLTPSFVVKTKRNKSQTRKGILNLKEILRDPANHNFLWFSDDPPKHTVSTSGTSSVEPDSQLSSFNDFILESGECTDDRVPRISDVRRLDKFHANFSDSPKGPDVESIEFPAIERETDACSEDTTKQKSQTKTGKSLDHKLQSPNCLNSAFDSRTLEMTSASFGDNRDDKNALLYKNNVKNDDPFPEKNAEGVDGHSLSEISKALENDGEFNDDEWYNAYNEEQLNEEVKNDTDEECDIEGIRNEEELSDEDLFAAFEMAKEKDCEEKNYGVYSSLTNIKSRVENGEDVSNEESARQYNKEALNICVKEELNISEENKDNNEDEKELCSTMNNLEKVENGEDISDEELVTAYNIGQSNNCEVVKTDEEKDIFSTECNLEGVEVRKNINKEDYMDDEEVNTAFSRTEDIGSQVSEDGESVRRIGQIIEKMDRKYSEMRSEGNKEKTEEMEGDDLDNKDSKKPFEDEDIKDLWPYDDWDDAMCSQESVINAIEADTESVSSDEETLDDNQDVFRSPEVVKTIESTADANNLQPTDRSPETQEPVVVPCTTVQTFPPLRPLVPQPPVSVPLKGPFQEKPAIIGRTKYAQDAMIERFLSWHVSWLDARREDIEIYSSLNKIDKLPKTFDSFDIYCRSFAPILAVEAWEQSVKEWKEGNKKKVISLIRNVVVNNKYVVINATTNNVKHSAVVNRALPEESELVILKCDGFRVFGLVDKVEQEVVYGRASSNGDGDDPNEKTYSITFTVRASRKTNFRPPENSLLEITVVASLLTTLRKWCGLVNFHQSLLARDILRPRGQTYFCSEEIPKQVKPSKMYNDSQSKVIHTAATAVHQAYTLPRICLVQGPPGTGKSHTIVGIVSSILNHPKAQETSQEHSEFFSEKTKILLCAPSNEAVDELIRKFLQAKPRKEYLESNKENRGANERGRNARGGDYTNCGDFCLVRVGRKSKINDSVKHMSLENITRREMEKQNVGTEENANGDVKDQLNLMHKRIDAVEKQKYITQKEETATAAEENLKESKLQELEKEKLILIARKKELERQYRNQRERKNKQKRMEARIKKEILNNADVICTTLSGSGSTSLLNDLRGPNGKKIPFSCVIVDEACQCCELDVLIPLQFRSSKLILVGDPEQLSATVISREAKHLLYGRSMFDRLYRVFRPIPRNERPVHLLSVQYRMHPEIAYFPSKHFYNDNIHTDSSLHKRVFPVKVPYAIFDVYRGRESNDNVGSISNKEEAELVSSTCHYLLDTLHIHSSDIGIITPYRSQRSRLLALLSDGACQDIEVKTVDGFQGGQKNVIIMSCVRTGSNIGFLEDLNRLNVALTRAQHALFVFGHMNTLKNFRGWAEMLKDADARKLVFSVANVEDITRVVSKATPSSISYPPNHAHSHPSASASLETPQNKYDRPMNNLQRSQSLIEPRTPHQVPSSLYRRTHSVENSVPSSEKILPNQSIQRVSSRYSDRGPELRRSQKGQENKDKDLLGRNAGNNDESAADCLGSNSDKKMIEPGIPDFGNNRNVGQDDLWREVVSKEDVNNDENANNSNGLRNEQSKTKLSSEKTELNLQQKLLEDAEHNVVLNNVRHDSNDIALPSEMEGNQSGHQCGLFYRLQQVSNFNALSEVSRTSNPDSHTFAGGGKAVRNDTQKSSNLELSRSSHKQPKSILKRPLCDKDDELSSPAKKFRFGAVEVFNTEGGGSHFFPLPLDSKDANPGRLQSTHNHVESFPNGGRKSPKNVEKGVDIIREKASNFTGEARIHSGGGQRNASKGRNHMKVPSASKILGKDRKGEVGDKKNTEGASSHQGKTPSRSSSRVKEVNPNQTGINSNHTVAPTLMANDTNQRHQSSIVVNNASLSSGATATGEEKRLNETVNRVKEGQAAQRSPLLIETPQDYRGGRGGRLRTPSRVADDANTVESSRQTSGLKEWDPYRPKKRTAQSNSTSVQDIRSRGVQVEVERRDYGHRRGQKRSRSKLNEFYLNSKKRK